MSGINLDAMKRWSAEREELRAEVRRLQADLAECYRLSGADPDGNEDWRIAPYAVVEVERLRRESDEAEARVAQLEDGLAFALHYLQSPGSVAEGVPAHAVAGLAALLDAPGEQ